jgi:hypothetical protein
MWVISSVLIQRSVRLTNPSTVCWHQHRHDDSPVSIDSDVGADSCGEQHRYQRPHLLGYRLQHGDRCQLWRLQHCIQRVSCGALVAGHSCPKTHSGAQAGICSCKSTYHCHFDDRGLCCPDRGGLHPSRNSEILALMIKGCPFSSDCNFWIAEVGRALLMKKMASRFCPGSSMDRQLGIAIVKHFDLPL